MQNQPPSPTIAPGEPQKDPELWFEDGNVVIVAGRAAFRVHTGVLSRHSEIFQNMFSVPQPPLPASSDVIDGHPVVHVSDSAHDFKQLLHVLYDGVKFMPPDKPVAFGIIGAITRLGHKYHVEWILDEAKRRLRSIFTTSFEVWSRHKGSSSDLVDISSYPPWMEAVNLIRLIGEIDMLPVAIYQCCQSPSLLFKGTTRVDGTVETLDLPTLEVCYNAHINLIQRQSELRAKVVLADPSEECKDKEICGTRMRATYRDIICPKPHFLDGDLMNSQSLVTIFRTYEMVGVICGICAAAFRERDRVGRRIVWRDLPRITGIAVDNWDQGVDGM